MSEEKILASETSVLALALLDEDCFYQTISTLKIDDFQDQRNKLIFEAMNECYEASNTRPNPSVLADKLKVSNKLDLAGGTDYLSNIITNVPPYSDLSEYIKQIKQTSSLVKMKEVLEKNLSQANKGVGNIPNFLDGVQKSVNDVMQAQNDGGFKTPEQVLSSYLGKLDERIEERRKTGKNSFLTGISSGYSELDDYTRGFQKGELVIIGARPSVGKTAFAINIATNIAHKKIPVAFFSLEMTAEQIMGRLLTNRTGIDLKTIESLNYTKTRDNRGGFILTPDKSVTAGSTNIRDLSNFQNAVNSLAKDPLFINDNPGTNVRAIQGEVRKLQTSHPDLGLVIIDYLGLIQSASAKTNSSDNRQNQVSDISRALKAMARDLKLPVIALSQLSRTVESRKDDHKPVMSDLRDSGSIEQDADKIMMLYRPDYYHDNDNKENQEEQQDQPNNDDDAISNVTVILAKNRNGKVGEIQFTFQKNVCHFNAIDTTQTASLDNEEPPLEEM